MGGNKKSCFILILILILLSCFNNAERDNPLDPNSGNYQNLGELQGLVYTFYAPFQPIPNATISLTPGFHNTATGTSGIFSLKNILPGEYVVTVSSEGYAPDSAVVHIEPNKVASLQFNLDGLPRVENLSLMTGSEYYYYLVNPVRYLSCKAEVADSDGLGDILSVAIAIPRFNFKDTLKISQVVGTYQMTYPESDLPVEYIEQLMGELVFIEITDKPGQICSYGPYFLTRIISDEPVTVAPVSNAQVNKLPLFRWQEIRPRFEFTFKIEIYLIIASQVIYPPLKTIANISSERFSYQLTESLEVGQYLWTISIVDKWGNWSRSTPATFQVIQ